MKVGLVAGLVGALSLFLGMQVGSPPVEVRLDQGTNFSVALAPDSSHLVMDLHGTLWVLPIEGGEAQPLTDGLGDDRLPDYSPDGSRLVFQSYRAGSWDIWAMGTDGSGLTALTEGRFDDREPVWSPDGTRIAFSSDRSGNYDLWILDCGAWRGNATDGRSGNELHARLVTGWKRGRVRLRAWRWSGYRTVDGRYKKSRSGSDRIVRGQVASPAWSPDGRMIVLRLLGERTYALSAWRFSEGIESDLVVIPAKGGEPIKKTSGEDVFPFRPAWAPNGDIIYTSDGEIRRLSGSGGRTAEDSFFRQCISGPARLLAPCRKNSKSGATVAGTRIVGPALSPDGEKLAFTALGDIWIASAEERVRFLSPATSTWTRIRVGLPMGRRSFFSSDRAGSMDLWKRKADSSPGSNAVRLTEFPGAEVVPVWSPDGRWLAYTDEQDDLYVIPSDGGAARLIRRSRRWAGAPSWSSDSKHLALATLEPYSTRFREGINRIVVISKDSGTERVVELSDDFLGRSFGSREGDGPCGARTGRSSRSPWTGALRSFL